MAYLWKLILDVANIVGDDATLDDAYNVCKYRIPFGGLEDPPYTGYSSRSHSLSRGI